MKKNYFSFSDFCITNEAVPLDIADKIYAYHLFPLQSVREAIGVPIVVSKRSAYRPSWWEVARKRRPDGEHTFKGKGACDVTCNEMDRLLVGITSITQYTRICYYPENNFYHCDYAAANKLFYINTWNEKEEKWEWIRQKGVNDILRVVRDRERLQ